jgi:acetyl esterase/lipase
MLVRGAEGRRQLVAVDLETLKPRVVVAVKDEDLAGYAWVNSRRLVYWMEIKLTGPNRTDSGPGLFGVDKDGERHRALKETRVGLLRGPESGVPLLDWRWYLQQTLPGANTDEVIIAKAGEVSSERVGNFELQRLNTVTGRVQDIETPLHSIHWVFDAQGRLVAANTLDRGEMTLQLRGPEGAFRAVARFPEFGGTGQLIPLAVTPDGSLFVEAPYGPTMGLWPFDVAAGQLGPKPLLVSPDFDLRPEPVLTAKGMLGLRVMVEGEATQWLDPAAQASQDEIDQRLPDTGNRISLPSEGNSPWVLVQAQSDVKPMQAYAYHRASKRLVRLGGTLSGLDSAQLGLMRFERVKARDGLMIPTYLTLPRQTPAGKDKPAQPPPMVVLVHGGPWARGMSWRFDPEVQFLASRGYAVLQPEFRGSTGFGRRHFEAGWRQWGLAMQDDVTDALRWAIQQGHADPKRICIAGASYGGYAALMGLVREPQLFRCAVNWLGVTDPMLFFEVRWSDITREFKTYGAARLIGDPQTEAEHFKTISPLHQAKRIQAPVLMAYGEWDLRVPLIHGEKLRDALKDHNRQVEWIVYPEEGHGWSRVETQRDFWRRVEAFLARHLAP